MAKDICVLAYSGGLDTSVCVRWLMDEMGLDVVCVVGEVGQEHEGLEQIRQRALEVGAMDCIVADMRETRRAGNQVIVICRPGSAEGVGAAIDAAHAEGVLGSIAGDDTLLVITQDDEAGASFQARVDRLLD